MSNKNTSSKIGTLTVDQMTTLADALIDAARKVMPENIGADGKIKSPAPAARHEYERQKRRAAVGEMQQQDPLFVLARNLREHFIPVAEKCAALQDTREAVEELREYKEMLFEIEDAYPEIRRDGISRFYH